MEGKNIQNSSTTGGGKPAERKPAIRTMRSDIDLLLKTTKPSLVQILSEETKKAPLAPRREISADFKKWALVATVSLFLVAAGLFSFWWFSQPTEISRKMPQKIVIPAPLFAIESSRTIEVRLQDRPRFFALMSDSLKEPERPGTIKRIIIKAADGPQERIATLGDFLSFYGITPPQGFLDRFDSPPMVFFYYGDAGPRWGIATKTKDGDRTLQDMLFWEDNLTQVFRPLLFTEDQLSNAAFEDRTYRNIDWRLAKLFPDRDFGIAYTVFPARNVWVMTTGKEAMEVVINRLFDVR